MTTNRRMFLSGVAAAIAWRPALEAAVPRAGIAGVAAPIAPRSGTPICRCNISDAILAVVACQLHTMMLDRLVLGKLVSRDFAPFVCQPGDTVNFPLCRVDGLLGGSTVVLTKHWEANFPIPDVRLAMERPVLLSAYLQPAATSIAEAIDQTLAEAENHSLLVTRRLPCPLPGTGALSHYVEADGIGTRTTMSYDPQRLLQLFTFDVLAGVGVSPLRSSFQSGRRRPIKNGGVWI